jgi:FMN reductase [NAD(P)H]
MNDVIHTLTEHRSIRKYKEDPLTEQQIMTIIKAAQSAPTWGNGQQVSVIGVQDPDKKRKLTELTGGQSWIAEAPLFLLFTIDYYRARQVLQDKGHDLGSAENVELLLIGSTDVGLNMGFAIAAAESMGLGIVPIGGIRRDSQTVIDMLELPEHVFPVSGLVVGYPDDMPDLKPRLPLESFYHKEKYNADQLPYSQQYDKEFAEYVAKRSQGAAQKNWSDTLVAYYSGAGNPRTADVLRKQGFKYK